jgi:hypothetical protein
MKSWQVRACQDFLLNQSIIEGVLMLSPVPVIFGIDPGIHGAIAVLDGASVDVFDMPVTDKTFLPKQKHRVDLSVLYDSFNRLFLTIPDRNKRQVVTFMEMSQSLGIGRTPPSTMYNIAEGAAFIEAAIRLAAYNCDMPLILRKYQPKAWTKWLFPDDVSRSKKSGTEKKKISLLTARELFPEIAASRLNLAKHEGRAEALLLAVIGIAEMYGCQIEPRVKNVLAQYSACHQYNGLLSPVRFSEIWNNKNLTALSSIKNFINQKMRKEK